MSSNYCSERIVLNENAIYHVSYKLNMKFKIRIKTIKTKFDSDK